MSSLKWFEGDSKAALQQMTDRNCALLIYIGIYQFINIICLHSYEHSEYSDTLILLLYSSSPFV